MLVRPQTTTNPGDSISEGRQLLLIPGGLPHSDLTLLLQPVSAERDQREKSQQDWCRARNRQIAPLALGFQSEMRARIFEGHLHRPAPHKPTQDFSCCVLEIGREQRLRLELPLRIANQKPANRERRFACVIPDYGLTTDLYLSCSLAIPIVDLYSLPFSPPVAKHLLKSRAALPFQTWSPDGSRSARRCRVIECRIKPQPRDQTHLREARDLSEQFDCGKAAIGDKASKAISHGRAGRAPAPLGAELSIRPSL